MDRHELIWTLVNPQPPQTRPFSLTEISENLFRPKCLWFGSRHSTQVYTYWEEFMPGFHYFPLTTWTLDELPLQVNQSHLNAHCTMEHWELRARTLFVSCKLLISVTQSSVLSVNVNDKCLTLHHICAKKSQSTVCFSVWVGAKRPMAWIGAFTET